MVLAHGGSFTIANASPGQHALMARAIAGAQLCITEQCGHMSTREPPEVVNAAFEKWLFQ